MALKFVIDTLEDVDAPLREHYVPENGKFYLATHGEHPKVSSFRFTNVDLMKERDALKAKFDGVDPDEYRVLKARPDVTKRATELETELAAERTAHAATQFKNTIGYEFLRAGGRAAAMDLIVGKAAETFTMKDGKLTSKEFSSEHPGVPLTLTEWMAQQTVAVDFAFEPSRGGGASGGRAATAAPTISLRPGQVALKSPSANDLGRHAAGILAGTVKIVD